MIVNSAKEYRKWVKDHAKLFSCGYELLIPSNS